MAHAEESKDDPEQPKSKSNHVEFVVTDGELEMDGRCCKVAIMELFMRTVVEELCNVSGLTENTNALIRRNRRFVIRACKGLVKAEEESDRIKQRLLVSKMMYRLVEIFQVCKEKMEMKRDGDVYDEELFPLLLTYNNNMDAI